MIYGIVLIVVSILAVPSLLLSRKPDAKELLEKIEPYQGYIGLVAMAWGVVGLIKAILGMSLLSANPLWWITWVAATAILALLGFMLGYGLLNKLFLSKSEEAKEKAAELRAKIAPRQGKLGIIGLIVGAILIITRIM